MGRLPPWSAAVGSPARPEASAGDLFFGELAASAEGCSDPGWTGSLAPISASEGEERLSEAVELHLASGLLAWEPAAVLSSWIDQKLLAKDSSAGSLAVGLGCWSVTLFSPSPPVRAPTVVGTTPVAEAARRGASMPPHSGGISQAKNLMGPT
mmetsp:Transcript_37859/g.84741  ORF Transcript_37859/g.84741 Transcript_37859/m.84741 type:complete len:153 (-) Transcript_37859:266-724(-)